MAGWAASAAAYACGEERGVAVAVVNDGELP